LIAEEEQVLVVELVPVVELVLETEWVSSPQNK